MWMSLTLRHTVSKLDEWRKVWVIFIIAYNLPLLEGFCMFRGWVFMDEGTSRPRILLKNQVKTKNILCPLLTFSG